MASTFTGLKLQGELGKFGRTELSDISGTALVLSHDLHHVILLFSICGVTRW